MNEKIEELEAIVELLREWVIKHDEGSISLYVEKDYTNVFNDPNLLEERHFDISHSYEPADETPAAGTAGESGTTK